MSAPGIVCMGEGMLEISGPLNGAARFSYGGDALNTAIYLARLGRKPRFCSALGADPLSCELRAAWTADGVDLGLTLTHPTRQPGLYSVRTAPSGERSFQYWRSESAARDLFSLLEADAALGEAERADVLYLSGITLSLYSEVNRARLVQLAQASRARGGRVVFDPNFRARLWSAADEARQAFDAIAPHVSIALPTLDDERLLRGDINAEQAAQAWLAFGVDEVAVKLGADGALVATQSHSWYVEQSRRIRAIDTTGAGDSFNAAYIDARLARHEPAACARKGHALAAAVVAHPGAIIPKEAMPALEGVL